MINLIVGPKGSGKTKVMIDQINETAKTAKGNVVCIEKNMNLIHDITNTVRLIDADSYYINSYERFYGFFAGLLAGNYDITNIFVDGALRIGNEEGGNVDDFENFLKNIIPLLEENNTIVTFTISAKKDEVSEELKKFPTIFA